MSAKLYGADDRALIINLLHNLDGEERNLRSIEGLVGASPLTINVCDDDFILTIDELRSVFQARIEAIKAQLRAKNIDIADAPERPLQSIERALHAQEQNT